MKKVFGIIVIGLFVVSCGGSTEVKPVEATYDSVGVDSSVILPALTDSATEAIYGGSGPRPGLNIK